MRHLQKSNTEGQTLGSLLKKAYLSYAKLKNLYFINADEIAKKYDANDIRIGEVLSQKMLRFYIDLTDM